MIRKVFASEEVADIVMTIIGEIEPVGETDTDDVRINHMRTLMDMLDVLIDEITFVLPCEQRYEWSMKRAGKEVRVWLEEKYQQFGYNLRRGEEDEAN